MAVAKKRRRKKERKEKNVVRKINAFKKIASVGRIDLSPGDRHLRSRQSEVKNTTHVCKLTLRSAQPQSALPLFLKTSGPRALFTLQFSDNSPTCLKRRVCTRAQKA